MKPRTKFQHKVVEASKRLPDLTPAQIRWAFTHVVEPIGRRTSKGEITCLDCGEVFHNTTKQKHCVCPHCGAKLRIEDTRKLNFKQREYAAYITTSDGLQVIRIFMVDYYAKIGKTPHYYLTEVMQRWIASNGKFCTMARLRAWGTRYCDSWIYSSDLELRNEAWAYGQIYTYDVYPRTNLIPELKQHGCRKVLRGVNTTDYFVALLMDNRAETLMKIGQEELLRHYLKRSGWNFDRYWPSIRIAARNGYIVKDASLWCDYLDALWELGKDLHSPKYVCPANLREEHDRYMVKLNRHREERRKAEREALILECEEAYQQAKARFFGLSFEDGKIRIHVLESVREFFAEGEAMHHCVYSNGYYRKDDSLILSATIDGKRIETVEVSLSKLTVVQSRGVCNQCTDYHARIIDLVNRNMPLIQQRIVA